MHKLKLFSILAIFIFLIACQSEQQTQQTTFTPTEVGDVGTITTFTDSGETEIFKEDGKPVIILFSGDAKL